MAVYKDLISTLRGRLNDWLIVNPVGGNIANLDLDLLNRAQGWLCTYRPWDFLKKSAALTLGSSNIAVLPDNLWQILEVYADVNGDGKPDWWYYQDDPDISKRYVLNSTFDTTTGHVWTISFPSTAAVLQSLVVRYIASLPDYVGATSDGTPVVEYSFWPGELLLRCAQKIFLEENGIVNDNKNAIMVSFREQLTNFEQFAQKTNVAMDHTIKNRNGVPVKMFGHAMDGSKSRSGVGPYQPSTSFYGNR